jgi:trehalose 6-phosphate synthase/phosphatase
MDSFSEPRKHTEYSLDEVRSQVNKLEQDHRAKGIPLSGRIIHVVHYLPVTCALSSKALNGSNGHRNGGQPGIPSPPQTPPAKASDIPPSPTEDAPSTSKSKWTTTPRYGHSAMVSGITSLATTHEQVVIGWTGDIQSSLQSDDESQKVPVSSISQEDKADLEKLLVNGSSMLKVEFPGDKPIPYIPVWLDDKQAHGHYDGYCKQSEFHAPRRRTFSPTLSTLWRFALYYLFPSAV